MLTRGKVDLQAGPVYARGSVLLSPTRKLRHSPSGRPGALITWGNLRRGVGEGT